MNVFRVFFFFWSGLAFVVAHRIVWYGRVVRRGIEGGGAIEEPNLLSGAKAGLMCAMAL
jgi:hypothetical protein